MRSLRLLTLLSLSLPLGCCAALDPSCATRRELTGSQAGRSLAFCPDTDLACIECHPWFGCPNAWTPECDPSLICGVAYGAPTDSAQSVYALPSPLQMRESRREFQRDPKRSELPRSPNSGTSGSSTSPGSSPGVPPAPRAP